MFRLLLCLVDTSTLFTCKDIIFFVSCSYKTLCSCSLALLSLHEMQGFRPHMHRHPTTLLTCKDTCCFVYCLLWLTHPPCSHARTSTFRLVFLQKRCVPVHSRCFLWHEIQGFRPRLVMLLVFRVVVWYCRQPGRCPSGYSGSRRPLRYRRRMERHHGSSCSEPGILQLSSTHAARQR